MTFETNYTGQDVFMETLESSDSSEGEGGYDNASYGSDVQPPSMTDGFVLVLEDSCRARYRPSRTAKTSPFYVCLNKSECRSLAGGRHSVLRGKARVKPGVYCGVYGRNGKLIAAQDGTHTSPESLAKIAEERRRSVRAQGHGLQNLKTGLESSTDTPTLGGLSSKNLTLSSAENLVVGAIDQEGG